MRGGEVRSGSLFSYVDLEARVARSHPLRAIRARWVSMIVRLRRRVGFFLGDEGGQRFSRRDGAGLSWRWRGAARRRE